MWLSLSMAGNMKGHILELNLVGTKPQYFGDMSYSATDLFFRSRD